MIEKIKAMRIVPRLRLARMELKEGWREAQEINRENNVFKDIKNLISDIKEEGRNGEVFTAGVRENEPAKNMLETARSGLESYAKTNNINITFYSPIEKGEAGYGMFKKPMQISVYSKGGVFGNNYIESKYIDADTTKITENSTVRNFHKGDVIRSVKSTREENFLQRAYRTISEMTNSIDARKSEDKATSFWG